MYCSYSIQIKSHINNMDRKATETILRFYAFWKQFPLDKLSTKCFEIQIKIESKKPKWTLLEGKKLHKKLCLIDYKFHYTYLIWIYIIETWKLRQIYFIDVRTYMQRPVSKVYIYMYENWIVVFYFYFLTNKLIDIKPYVKKATQNI